MVAAVHEISTREAADAAFAAIGFAALRTPDPATQTVARWSDPNDLLSPV